MFAPLPRRRLIKGLLFAPIIVTTTMQAGCNQVPDRSRERVTQTKFGRLLVLDVAHAEILWSLSQVCLDFESKIEAQMRIANTTLIKRLDEELFFVSHHIQEDFCLALKALQFLPVLYGKFSRFTHLSLEQRSDLVEVWMQTSSETVRSIIHALRMAVMLSFYGSRHSWGDLAYDGSFAQLPELHSQQRKYYAHLTLDQISGSESSLRSERRRGEEA